MSNNVGAIFDAGHESFDALTTKVWTPLGRATIALSRPASGERVLDACCGAGASAIPTAAAVGPNGRVDGIDLSEQLLELGRSRAENLPQLIFHHGAVMSWPFGPYDLVQCVLGLFLLPDPAAGATAVVGRLRPGGRCAVTVWHKGAVRAVGELLAAAVTPEGVPVIRRASDRLNTPGELTNLLRTSGLRDVEVHEVPHNITLEPELAWDVVLVSGMRRQLAGMDAAMVDRVRQRFLDGWTGDPVDFTVLVGLGRKPA
jgi:ubiquinone/menaquinone biosynthesis C-methylase UbiE